MTTGTDGALHAEKLIEEATSFGGDIEEEREVADEGERARDFFDSLAVRCKDVAVGRDEAKEDEDEYRGDGNVSRCEVLEGARDRGYEDRHGGQCRRWKLPAGD